MLLWRFIAVFVYLLLSYTTALDLSFIPNDENAPLPLSQRYRDSLRKLCALMKPGGRIPPELQEKKVVMEKMCAKLLKDDQNVEYSEGALPRKWDFRTFAFTLLGVGGGYVAWNRRHLIKSTVERLIRTRPEGPIGQTPVFVGENVGVIASDGPEDHFVAHGDADQVNLRILEAREARLKRFSEINVNPVNTNLIINQ